MRKIPSLLLVVLTILHAALSHAEDKDLGALSLEELGQLEVTTVSKRPQPLGHVPAAVYVIRGEDIRRSGATSLPEALRLAPGVQVSRISSSQYSVSIRGFASTLSRSLLVLIDGRSVYSPLFAGVYWEAQDVLLSNIDRIEVIRGPGGTLWGANAVNGIINIITKHSSETQGGLVELGGGSEERFFGSARYGASPKKGLTYRVHGKAFLRGDTLRGGESAEDAWKRASVGFRLDQEGSASTVLQGDLYQAEAPEHSNRVLYEAPYLESIRFPVRLSGGNLRLRSLLPRPDGSTLIVRAYYDYAHRSESLYEEARSTVDLALERRSSPLPGHTLSLGLGYRLSDGNILFGHFPMVVIDPPRRVDHLFSAYAEDTLSILRGRVELTAGTKIEHNGYSGLELQPSVRATALVGEDLSVWAAASRSVRSPSRSEHDSTLTFLLDLRGPVYLRLVPDRLFDSERLLALEVGARWQRSDQLFLDVAAFVNHYDRLFSLEPGAPFTEEGRLVVPITPRNLLYAESFGAEAALEVQLLSRWRVAGTYSYLRFDLDQKPESRDPFDEWNVEGASPRNQASARSSLTLFQGRLELDALVRYVGSLPSRGIPEYASLDLRVGLRLLHGLELTVAGQNLLSADHAEFNKDRRVERGLYAKAIWSW